MRKFPLSLPPLVALFAGLAAPAPAQSSLGDQSIAVMTTDGLFLVEANGPNTLALADASDFGVTQIVSPSIEWIRGSDAFLVAMRDTQGQGGLWRVTISNGLASIVDLTPNIQWTPKPDFRDLDSSLGRDSVFLLDSAGKRIFELASPLSATGSELEWWADVTAPEPRSLTAVGSDSPFSVIVTGRTETRRYRANGNNSQLVDYNYFWQVDENRVTGEWYGSSQNTNVVGKFVGGAVINFNADGSCINAAQRPVDFEWDSVWRGAVILAENGMLFCAFGGVAVGPNHIGRFPVAVGPKPAQLLTPSGGSGITGVDGDLAIVRHDESDLTFEGQPVTGPNGQRPFYESFAYSSAAQIGEDVVVGLSDAPTQASAWLLASSTRLDGMFQGQWVLPQADQLYPVTTDVAGAATLTIAIPNDPAFLGRRFYTQWWVEDTSTALANDVLSSQGAIFTVGVK